MAAPAGAAQAARPPVLLDLPAYVSTLQRVRDRASDLRGKEEAEDLSRDLPERWLVRYDAESVEVSTGWLRGRLRSCAVSERSCPWAGTQIRARVEAMLREADAIREEPGGIVSRDTRARLSAILARPEFAVSEEPSWLERLRRRVSAWVRSVFDRLFGKPGSLDEAGSIVFWLTMAAALSTAAVWTYRFFRRARGARAAAGIALKPLRADTRRWRERAADAARDGRWRDAIMSAHWLAVHHLCEEGVLELDPARTHREYVRDLPAYHGGRTALDFLSRTFESTWYGGRPATEETWRAVLAPMETLGCPLPPPTAAS